MELQSAERTWIRLVQTEKFKSELNLISAKANLPKKSPLTALRPFLDSEGVLRVGGRIKHAPLMVDERHPISLPSLSKFTSLVVEACHLRALHGGTQLTLSMVRQRYWIPQGRNLTKQVIRRCVTCIRWRATTSTQLMTDLLICN